jgi:acid phosphatase family membrane protein YuiD
MRLHALALLTDLRGLAGSGAYLIAPLVGWVVAGSLKFAINSFKSRAPAWREIGYGGMPSTHAAIVGTTAVLVGLKEGWNTAVFAIAATLALIVMLDAASLRGHIATHARALNSLMAGDPSQRPLRERIGHRWTEVAAGAVVGALCALLLDAAGP